MTWLVVAADADGMMHVAGEDGSQTIEITSVSLRLVHTTGAHAHAIVPTESAPRVGDRLDAAAFDALLAGCPPVMQEPQ